MAEWLKAAVLKTHSARSGKLHKIQDNLLPAKDLQTFSISPDCTRFHGL